MFKAAPIPAFQPRRRRRLVAIVAMALACLGATSFDAYAQFCQPRRSRPPVTLTTLGACEFNPAALSFSGEPAQQAMCLLRSSDRSRNLSAPLTALPAALATRVGQSTGLPERPALAAMLTVFGLVWDYAPFLWKPISRALDNHQGAPQARYFVIHDTSAPNFGGQPFPDDIDQHRGINNLARYRCADGFGPAHVVINRTGAMLLTHEFSEPWRATKFERGSQFGTDLRGLFLHIELVQPRRSAPGRGRSNDAMAPTPGFSRVQYERLALVYVIASVRSGQWLIPAFHAAIDARITGGHDDPQNFDLDAFAASIDQLVSSLERYHLMMEPPREEATLTAPPAEDVTAVAAP